jgi:amidase
VIHEANVTELSARLARREVSSVELTRSVLAAIEERDGGIAAFVELDARRALRAAARVDAARKKGAKLSPLAGIPTAIKDHEHMRFMGTRAGSRMLRYVRSPVDGEVARRCRAAGMPLVGKTSCSELTILPFVETDIAPPTRNPKNLDHYSGGSSGGASAAVGAGMLPIAPGSDGAGSIRGPASFCGLVGFKPSRHALFHEHHAVDPHDISAVGPLARSVHDAAMMLDVLAGDLDVDADVRSFRAAAKRAPRALNIRFSPRSAITKVHPEIEEAVRRAARLAEQLGHRVEEAEPVEGTVDEFLPLMAKMISGIPQLPYARRFLQPTTRWMVDLGRRTSEDEARASKDLLQGRVDAWFGDAVDAWITPTSCELPPRIGQYDGMGGEETFRAVVPIGALTAPFNVSGQPAVSLPLAVSSSGLPIGVQIVMHRGDDRRLLGLAAQIEEASPITSAFF